MRKRRILVVTQEQNVPPDSIEGLSDKEIAPFKTDFDVVATLEELGHTVEIVGLDDDLAPLRSAIDRLHPHLVFNLLESFAGKDRNVALVLGYLDLIGQAYTGCNPVGMLLSNDKALQRKILRYHRINVPEFAIFRRGQTVRRPHRLAFPVIVKALTLHGSVGISQASVVGDDERLEQRVQFMHEHAQDDVIAERYIEGRELYLGMIGNHRLQTFPIWELHFENLPEGARRIATDKVKWDHRYQERSGVSTGPAELSDEMQRRIISICKRAYRNLHQTGYCRMDMRLDEHDRVFLIESNPNPQLSFGEDFAESAEAAGLDYPQLLQRLINLGLRQALER